jgi:Ca2+-binding RTX toxin-like protein
MSSIQRIGAFFDGTGNHKDNDKAINDGSLTNIGKLHDAYGGKAFYVEGVGTRPLSNAEVELVKQGITNKNDYYNSSAMAFGTEVKAKVNEMLYQVKSFISNNPDSEVVIDVFGFSRGSTEARDFINEINTLYADNPNVKIGVAGLYDTVATVGLSNEYNDGLNLDLSGDSAEKVIHFTAKNETRFNFSLESLKDENGNLPPNFMELEIAGAHADIGGGYKFTEKEYYKEESGFVQYSHELDKEYQINKIKQEALENGFEIQNINEVSNGMLSYDIMSSREVSSGLSNVSLKLMSDLLIQSGVPIDTSKLSDSLIPNDLNDYYNNLLHGDTVSLSFELINKYVHNSDTGERTADSLSDTLANFEEPSGQRDIYTNNPNNAVSAFNREVLYNSEDNIVYYRNQKGNWEQLTYNENNDLLIYGDPNNPQKITFTDERGDYQVWERDKNGEFVRINSIDYSVVTNTAINQIGSLIISNNPDFSNIEKIAVSTSVATIADFVTYKGTEEFNSSQEGVDNLKGAVVSFAVSSYFAKNDNISDLLGMDGTFLGDLADFTVSFTTSYSIGVLANNGFSFDALSNAFSSTTNSATGAITPSSYSTALGGAIGGYLGSALANEIMDWDTKEESMGASIGSAIGSVMALLMTNPVGWVIAALYAFGGSFIGNIIGGIIGGLFGGDDPIPTASASYEFDEETLTYSLISSDSSDGGNEKAMKSIGEGFAKQLINMFQITGGQLVDADRMPEILISQYDQSVKVNGFIGSFDNVQDIMASALSVNIPIINVEGGNPYILRAIHKTNEMFLEGDPDADTGRADIVKLYENISLATDYSKYMTEQTIIVDANGNIITDTEILALINAKFKDIQAIEDETDKQEALNEFLKEYQFISQKEYVDKLLEINDSEKQEEIDYWKEVFRLAQELDLDTPHYSEDFNKLNSEIAKYNYNIRNENQELLDIDYDEYISQIKDKMLAIYEGELDDVNITKQEAKEILTELGHNVSNIIDTSSEFIAVEISIDRLNELMELAGIENPFNVFEVNDEEFSFDGKTLNDLQFMLQDGNLVIKTFEKDLEESVAEDKSKTFFIKDWEKWDKTNTHLELPDGTKVNLQALLDLIGVEEGKGFVDVNEAFVSTALVNETISSYLEEYQSKNLFFGTDLDDKINAYFGNNLIIAGDGKNTIKTGAGDDVIFAHDGVNSIVGGLGNDTVSYELSDSAVYTSLEKGGINGIATGDTYDGIENLIGSKYDDVLEGDGVDNTIFGKDGNDILTGKDGSDTLDGGAGIDIASYESSQNAVEINLGRNYAFGGEATGDSFVNIEGIRGSVFGDAIIGDSNANIMYANKGNDRISTEAGNDIVFAGDGDDYVRGDSGNDTLYGEKGNDVLVGGSGDDLLFGGEGKNIILGEEGKDIVVYKGISSDYEVMFFNNNTLLIKSKDGTIQDTLKDIEEIVFDDALFEVDYENRVLIKKAVFDGYDLDNTQDSIQNTIDENNNQAAAVATAVMIGTVAAAQTEESSSDEISYLSDDPASLDELDNNTAILESVVVPILTVEHNLYESIQLIKKYVSDKQDASVVSDDEDSTTLSSGDSSSAPSQNVSDEPTNNTEDKAVEVIVMQQSSDATESSEEIDSNEPIIETFGDDDDLDPLIPPQIIFNETVIYEDNNLFGIEIINSNSDTVMQVVFFGIPDTFSLSAGEKRADGNWYLVQNDLQNLQLIPQTNNSDDFELTIKAIVTDTHGRIITTEMQQEIQIIAVADVPNLVVDDTIGLEDTAIPLVISASLVDTLGGADGEEELSITIENVPNEALLNAGIRDENGLWHLQVSDLENLTITPKLNDGNDFTIKVNVYATESENGDVAYISEDIFVHVVAVADVPNLEVDDTIGLEDTAIPLVISASLVDTLGGADGEESIILSIENVPSDAILSSGVRDNDGIWYLTPEDLTSLTITPKLHDGNDFVIRVTAYSIESENGDIASVSEDITVDVVPVADLPVLELTNVTGDEDTNIMLNIVSELVDNDNSEILSLSIDGIPQNAVLSNGIKDENGIWHLTKDELNLLYVTPESNNADDFVIRVTAKTVEKENGDIAEIAKDMLVQVNAVADNVVFNLYQEVSGQDGVAIFDEDPGFAPINIASEFIDLDGSESVYYIIEGLPDNTTLTAGEMLEDGKWRLLPEDLENLGVNIVENSDVDFSLKVTAVTTEVENQHQTFTTKYIDIQLVSSADFANLSVSDSKGYQNDFIDLKIESSLVDIDGSEELEIIIEQIPNSAVLNKGSKDENGFWHLSKEDLTGLKLRPEFNSLDSIELKVRAVTTEKKNVASEESVAYIKVTVEPLPSSADIIVNPAQCFEDEVCDIDISVDVSDLKPLESLYLEVEIPENCTLNNGEKINQTKWKLALDDLQGLTLKANDDYAGSFLLDIRSVIIKANGALEYSPTSIKLPVDIIAVADKPTLEIDDIIANEDDLIHIDIASKLSDIDGSESLRVKIEGLPDDALLSVGTKVDGIWTIEQKDIDSVFLLMPEDTSGDFQLTIKAQSIEKTNNDRAETIKVINLHIDEVIDKPILHTVDSFIKNNEADLDILSAVKDNDGSESLTINISNLPIGSFLNNGVLQDDGSYDLVIEDLDNLKIMNISENAQLNIVSKINGSDTNLNHKTLNINLSDDENMYISINDLNIVTDSFYQDVKNMTNIDDIVQTGGLGDVIYAQGGNDIVYADTRSGFIHVSFAISTDILLEANQNLLIEIDNLPDGTISSEGNVYNNKLIIDGESFSGNIYLSYPNQQEEVSLTVNASVVNINDASNYIKTISLPLIIDTQEREGNDYISAGIGNDTIYGQAGNDIILGGSGNDILWGNEGNDYISGGAGADKADAGSGDDFIVMDYDDFNTDEFLVNIVNGGDGFDTVKIDDTRGVIFDMGLTNIEKFIGGDGDDVIIGSEFADIVIGGGGADVFYTLGGNDIVYIDREDIKAQSGNFIDTGSGYDIIYIDDSIGVIFDVANTNAEEIISGSGDDTIYASDSEQILNGGEGIDTISFVNSNAGVNVNLSTGISSGGYSQGDIIVNFENIVGTDFDDILVGNSKDNIFYAKNGNNIIDGGDGYDIVVIDGSLKEYYNGTNLNNIVTDFNFSAIVSNQYGITDMSNIEQINFNDFVVYINGDDNFPIVYDDTVYTQEDNSIEIDSSYLLNNDFGISDGALRIVGVQNATNGSVSMGANGKIVFNPDKNYNSSFDNVFDTNSALYKDKAGFEYIVEDGNGNTSIGYTTVNVSAVNDAPEILNHYFNRNSRYTGSGKFVINDVDSDINAITINVVSSLAYSTSYTRFGFVFNHQNGGHSFGLVPVIANKTGSTNINGRSIEEDGEFYFNYNGSVWKDGAYYIYDMRPFTVQISDSGDVLTGDNKQSILYQTGKYFHYVHHDPVILDMDGDGIELEEKYYESFGEYIVGVSGDDAVLFWDMDGDKKISSSFETDWSVFDENATNDFDVMRSFFDSNKDGVFDSSDEFWSEFALWQDKNNDGLMGEDEYMSIIDSGISKLNLEDMYSKDGQFPIDEYSTYVTQDNKENIMASAYIETAFTEDKLSEIDKYILLEASRLNEQLAVLNSTESEGFEIEIHNIFGEDYKDEDIA